MILDTDPSKPNENTTKEKEVLLPLALCKTRHLNFFRKNKIKNLPTNYLIVILQYTNTSKWD